MTGRFVRGTATFFRPGGRLHGLMAAQSLTVAVDCSMSLCLWSQSMAAANSTVDYEIEIQFYDVCAFTFMLQMMLCEDVHVMLFY